MLNAARAHGMPMMVIAMITEASSQPAAIQAPPQTIHSRLSSREKSDIADPRASPATRRRRRIGSASDNMGIAVRRCQGRVLAVAGTAIRSVHEPATELRGLRPVSLGGRPRAILRPGHRRPADAVRQRVLVE